jgi:hypothetical protein
MNDATLDWLLGKDNPSVRYFALRHLLDRPDDERDVQAARRAIMRSEPIQAILARQMPEGYWAKEGWGYSPKYRSTDWTILFLAELGADGRHRQVRRGCEYVLSHAPAPHGGFSAMAGGQASGAVTCLNGNLLWALGALGCSPDDRARRAADWLASVVTGQGVDQWYASTVSGPGFACGVNLKQPCAWGAVKSLRALANLPPEWQSDKTRRATRATADFLLSRDPAKADYPFTGRVSGEWFKFGFPLSYTSDVLEVLLALGEAGYGRDPRLANALALVESKRGADGRWRLKHSLNGRMWIDVEAKGQPSKWVTLRALRVLKGAGR